MPSTFAQSGTAEVLLPSGWRVRVILPSLRHLIRRGILPTHLHEPALRGADPSWLTPAETRDERVASIAEYLDFLVAWSIRESQPPGGEWQPEQLTAAEAAGIDPLDLDMLESLVLRDKTPAEVSTISAVLLGLPAPEPGPEVAIPGWAEFRSEPGGTAAGTDGEPLADAPELAATGAR